MIYEWLGLTFVLFPLIPAMVLIVDGIIQAVKRHRAQEERRAEKYIESYVQYRIRKDRETRKIA